MVPPGLPNSIAKLAIIIQKSKSDKEFGRFGRITSANFNILQQIISDIPADSTLNFIDPPCKMPKSGIFHAKHTFLMPLFPKVKKWAGTGLSNYKIQKPYGKF